MKQPNEKKSRFPIFRERLNQLLGDMSTTEFAEKVGITRQTMGFYLNGERIPDSLGLVQICTSCNVSSDWLLGLTNDPNPQPCATDALGLSAETVSDLRELTDTQRHGFEKIINTKLFGLLCEDVSKYLDIQSTDKLFALPSGDIYDSVADAGKVQQEVEETLKSLYPALSGRISVAFGVNHAQRVREGIINSFEQLLTTIDFLQMNDSQK